MHSWSVWWSPTKSATAWLCSVAIEPMRRVSRSKTAMSSARLRRLLGGEALCDIGLLDLPDAVRLILATKRSYLPRYPCRRGSAPDEGIPHVQSTRNVVPRSPQARARRCGSSRCSSATASPAASATPTARTSRSTGFESTEGFTLVESEFDDGSGSPQSGQIVFEAEQGVDDPAVRAAMEEMFAEVAEIDDVTAVQSPYAPGGEFQISSRGDAAGHDRVRDRQPARGHRLHPRRRDRRRDPRARSPTSTGCASSSAASCSPSSNSRRPSCSASPSPSSS